MRPRPAFFPYPLAFLYMSCCQGAKLQRASASEASPSVTIEACLQHCAAKEPQRHLRAFGAWRWRAASAGSCARASARARARVVCLCVSVCVCGRASGRPNGRAQAWKAISPLFRRKRGDILKS
eukprot:1687370-Pleurochrysis_carterae.AAC.1